MNDLEDFLSETAAALDADASMKEFGVSRIVSFELSDRFVEVGTNGSMLWLVAGFDWPEFPTDGTAIVWAPDDPVEVRQRRHVRCKPDLFEGPYRPGDVKLGTERFKPRYAARWADEVVRFVVSLDKAVRDPADP